MLLPGGGTDSSAGTNYSFPLTGSSAPLANGHGTVQSAMSSTNRKVSNGGGSRNGQSVIMPAAANGGQGMVLLQSPVGSNRSYGGRGSRGSRNASESDKDSLASSRHRELHKTLEKNRRAHLRHCFEQLKTELPKSEYSDKKTSHINIIHCAIRYIQYLKRTEWEYEHEMERLARTKIRYQNQLAQVKEDMMTEKASPVDIEDVLVKAAARVVSVPASSSASASATVIVTSGKSSSSSSLMSAPSSASNLSLVSMGKSPLIHGLKSEEDESNDTTGDVIVELDAGEDYDDEATNTASGMYSTCLFFYSSSVLIAPFLLLFRMHGRFTRPVS